MAELTLRNIQLNAKWDDRKGRLVARSPYQAQIGGLFVSLISVVSMNWALQNAGNDMVFGTVFAAIFGAVFFVLGIVIALSKTQVQFDPFSRNYIATHLVGGSGIHIQGTYEDLRSVELVHEIRRASSREETGESVLAFYLNWKDGRRWELFAVPDGGTRAADAATQAEMWAGRAGLMLVVKQRAVEVVFRSNRAQVAPSDSISITSSSEVILRNGSTTEVVSFDGRALLFGSSKFDIFEVESIYVARGGTGVVVESENLIARLGDFLIASDQDWVTSWLIDRIQESREAVA